MYTVGFFFHDTATTEIYTYRHTLSLHDALPIWRWFRGTAPSTEHYCSTNQSSGSGRLNSKSGDETLCLSPFMKAPAWPNAAPSNPWRCRAVSIGSFTTVPAWPGNLLLLQAGWRSRCGLSAVGLRIGSASEIGGAWCRERGGRTG